MIRAQVGESNLACVVVEPIQGEGGFVVPAEGFLPALAAWCERTGTLFVADEIQTGLAVELTDTATTKAVAAACHADGLLC